MPYDDDFVLNGRVTAPDVADYDGAAVHEGWVRAFVAALRRDGEGGA